jgi:hypothetical protein
MAEQLKLRAADEEDLQALSAILQDALVPVSDMAYLPEERQFVLIANRFCWECAEGRGGPAPDEDSELEPPDIALRNEPFERVHAGLCFENVERVRSRDLDLRERGRILSLLTMLKEEDQIFLLFAGGGVIELTVDSVRCRLEDLDEPWPTRWRPTHADEEEHAAG